MAERKIYIGSVGPFLFEDTDPIDDEDGEFAGETQRAFVSNKQMLITETPSSDEEIMRLGDSNKRILGPLSVTNIDDPSVELGGKSGSAGTLILVYQVKATRDEVTLYEWEAANSGGVDIPYVVAGSSGFWIAIGGKIAFEEICVLIADIDASGYGFFLDEDNMISDSPTKLASQQSIKAYVDACGSGVAFATAAVLGTL